MKIMLWASVLLVIACFLAWQEGFHINLTGSLPRGRGIYRMAPATLEHGSLVAFCLGGNAAADALNRGYLKPGVCPAGTQPLLKQVAALPGDSVFMAENGVSICSAGETFGCLWPAKALPADSKGKPLPHTEIAGVVPQGQALLLNPHPDSFDSRYFGLVSLNALATVEPFYLISME